MTTLVFARRFLADYGRNPVNLLLLAIVPVVFVIAVAGPLADAAKLLGGAGGPAVETATAGWAAGFLAAIGMYFQVAAVREVDRRTLVAGLRPSRLVAARLTTGLTLAVVAAGVALAALAARGGLDDPVRVVAGTGMFAVIYLAIGAVVGASVPNPVNGAVLVLFVWMLDVFFGPAMGARDLPATRGLPTHFVTLWAVDLPSGHGGRIGDLGWALAWTAAAAAAAWLVLTTRVRTARSRRESWPGGRGAQLAAAGRAAWRDARRNPVLWALFVVVPVVFILIADAVTPDEPIGLTVTEHGAQLVRTISMADVHGATMAPIAVASLAALVGLFTMLDSRAGDRRAAIAGLRPGALLAARLGTLAVATLAATVVSLAATALVFNPSRWMIYAAGNVLIALTYGLVGALLAPVFGRVGGVFVAFLLPFLDVGIAQSPMLHPNPTAWSRGLPGFGGSRVLLDGALTRGFDQGWPLLVGLLWLAALAIAVTVAARPARARSAR